MPGCKKNRYGARYRIGVNAQRPPRAAAFVTNGDTPPPTNGNDTGKKGINPIVVVGIGLAALFLRRRR